MSQWLRAHVALAEEPGSVIRTHTMDYSYPLTPVPGDLALSSHLIGPQARTYYIYTQTKHHTHKIKSQKNKAFNLNGSLHSFELSKQDE